MTTSTETAPACAINREDGVGLDLTRTRQRVVIGFDFADRRDIEQQRRAALQAALAAALAPAVRDLASVQACQRLERTRRECQQQLQTLRARAPALEAERSRLLVAGEAVDQVEAEQAAIEASLSALLDRVEHATTLLAARACSALQDITVIFRDAGQQQHRDLQAARELALAELEAAAVAAAAAVLDAEVDLTVARQAVLSVQGQAADPAISDDAAARLQALLGRLGVE